jgi:hypothetical protein
MRRLLAPALLLYRATYSNFHGYGWDRTREPTDPTR